MKSIKYYSSYGANKVTNKSFFSWKDNSFEEREHGSINGFTPSEMFLMKGRLNNSSNNKKVKQIKESVTHVGK